MGNIVLLDELTINKIAAGEVIERPASVIKEMVENSIDAGATNITVEIKNGGISFIKITDNGKGIAQDDLEIAFERHATSKIRSADDLDTVTSMGFRGEALASIAAISTVELTSKTKEQGTGYKVVVEAGDVLQKEEVGCQNGTTITVRNLFFNTPVRYKFLKKDYTEAGYIEDVITRIALVNPNIAIKLINSGKTIIQTNGSGELKNVIYSIYGKDVANGIMETTYEYEDIKITGVIGKPEIARSNRSNQLFFVNKRYIKDKTLTAATEQAYKGLIPIGKFGFVVLNIEMNPAMVDVNVHPAKLEVRFQEENKIFQAVYHAIKDTLLKTELVANAEKRLDRTAESFEERLKNIRENGKQQSGGLFSFRKQKGKQIEQYTEEESKIKTNKVEERKLEQKDRISTKNHENLVKKDDKTIGDIGQPIDTSDILLQLKQMKEKIEKEIVDKKNGIEVKEESENYNLEGDNKEQINENIEQKAIWKNYTVNLDLNVDDNSEEKSKKIDEDTEENLENSIIKSEEEIIENAEIPQETNEVQNNTNEDIEIKQTTIEDGIQGEIQSIGNEVEMQIKAIEESENSTQNEIKRNIENEINEDEMLAEEDSESNMNSKENELEILNVNLAIENIDDPDVQKEFEEVKQKMQDLNNNSQKEATEDFNEMYTKLFGRPPIQEQEEEEDENEETDIDIINDNISVFEDQEEFKKPTYKFIGIVFKTYIILEIDKEMYILDQHAAHERIMYEKVKKNYYSDTTKDSQILLLPDVITLTHKEMDIAKDNMQMFRQAGFSLEEFGENTIKLTGVPSVCIDLNNRDLFLETLDEINTVARTAKQEKEEKFIATVACKAAVKANMALTDEEVASLMNELLELPNPFTCPHGRPTAIKMTKYDIERKFARK